MTEPEQALPIARAHATAMRAGGAYAGVEAPAADPSAAADDKLLRWAEIEPDLHELRSNRRAGVLLTAVRRILVRLVWPYFAPRLAGQSRFNLDLLLHLRTLEDRVDELARRLEGARAPATPPSPNDS